jgi:hypothetical protein
MQKSGVPLRRCRVGSLQGNAIIPAVYDKHDPENFPGPTAEAFTGLWRGCCRSSDARQMSSDVFLKGQANV